MSVFARLKKAREEKKGFTLVELIVVLVILAILAAILVPALLGWIDEARNKQYVLEARNIYVATQAVADEAYANSKSGTLSIADLSKNSYKRIVALADLKSAPTISEVTVKGDGSTNRKDAYSIIGMAVSFTADDNTSVAARLLNGKWEVATASADGTVTMPPATSSDYPAGSATLTS